MNGLTSTFASAVAAQTVLRWWLARRQIVAVRAHRDCVPAAFAGVITLADQQRAADYTIARVRFGRWTILADAAIKLGLTVGGGLAAIEAIFARVDWPEPWHGALVILAVGAILQVLSLPFGLWRTFRIEARFGFNRMTPGLFAADLAKQWLLSLALLAPLVVALVTLMQRAGSTWWLWCWLGWMLVSLTLTWAAPRFIAPMFNRFTAITDPKLKERVEGLLARCGFAAGGGVFVMDGSRRSAHGNAYFTGIGRHKRIVFFDTLLARIDLEEIEAVLAHELGHFRLHHIRQRLITTMAGSLGGLALLGFLVDDAAFYQAFGVQPTAASALLLFAFTAPVFTFFATPFASWWSRRQELQADAFAAAQVPASNLVTALIKLYRDNASTLTPDPIHSAFYDSHPSAVERITRLRRLASN